MPLQSRRVFRVSFTVALSLAIAQGMALPLPFLAPTFDRVLTARPAPPMRVKSLLGLVLVVLMTLGVGLVLIGLLMTYQVSAVMIVAAGLCFSAYLTVNLGKALVGCFLTIGFTVISVAGTLDFALAVAVIWALVLGIGVAIVCQWIVYPWLPEGPAVPGAGDVTPGNAERRNCIALRAALFVLPPFLLALSNPSMYLPIILKAVQLRQPGSVIDARHAGRELLASTFLGGCFAVAFWLVLGVVTNLWMLFFWMLLSCVYFTSRLYQVSASRFPPSFWRNVTVTMLILPRRGEVRALSRVYLIALNSPPVQ